MEKSQFSRFENNSFFKTSSSQCKGLNIKILYIENTILKKDHDIHLDIKIHAAIRIQCVDFKASKGQQVIKNINVYDTRILFTAT